MLTVQTAQPGQKSALSSFRELRADPHYVKAIRNVELDILTVYLDTTLKLNDRHHKTHVKEMPDDRCIHLFRQMQKANYGLSQTLPKANALLMLDATTITSINEDVQQLIIQAVAEENNSDEGILRALFEKLTELKNEELCYEILTDIIPKLSQKLLGVVLDEIGVLRKATNQMYLLASVADKASGDNSNLLVRIANMAKESKNDKSKAAILTIAIAKIESNQAIMDTFFEAALCITEESHQVLVLRELIKKLPANSPILQKILSTALTLSSYQETLFLSLLTTKFADNNELMSKIAESIPGLKSPDSIQRVQQTYSQLLWH